MKLIDIIEMANNAYNDSFKDNLIRKSYALRRNGGDALAYFIAKELNDTFDEDAKNDIEQLTEARRAVIFAYDNLGKVIDAFEKELEDRLQE